MSAAAANEGLLNMLSGQVAGNFKYHHYDSGGNLLWIIEGDTPVVEAPVVKVQAPRLVLIQPSGNASFKAGTASYDTVAQTCSLREGVIVEGMESTSFRASSVDLALEQKVLTFPGPFHALHGGFRIASKKGSFNMNTGNFKTEGSSQLEYTETKP